MTGFMSVDQVESDMQDAVAGLYAKTLTYYTVSYTHLDVYKRQHLGLPRVAEV